MNLATVIDVAQLYGEKILAGAANGQAFFIKLVDATNTLTSGSVIGLDLSKVELISASFFRAAFRAFRDYARTSIMCYLVFLDGNAATVDEVRYFAEATGDAFPFGVRNKSKELTKSFLVGNLDEKQASTLKALVKLKEADASQLFDLFPDTGVASSAAWSNRLANLAAKGLVIERTEGRLKKYRPIVESLNYGT